MSKRDLERRLDHLAARAQVRPIPIIPTIDAITWTEEDWQTYIDADPGTREAMRLEHDRAEAELIATARANLPPSDDPNTPRMIVVKEHIPTDVDAWRYDGEPPSGPAGVSVEAQPEHEREPQPPPAEDLQYDPVLQRFVVVKAAHRSAPPPPSTSGYSEHGGSIEPTYDPLGNAPGWYRRKLAGGGG